MSDNEKENTANDDIKSGGSPLDGSAEDNSGGDSHSCENTDAVNIYIKDIDKEKADKKKKNIIHEIISWAATIAGAVILAYLITNFIIVNAEVPTESMEDTIMAGDRLIAFRLSYLFDEPSRYDIVVFKYPDDESTLFIKRIIGMPGEKVTIKRDSEGAVKVYINDSDTALDDYFIKEPMALRDGYSENKELTYIVPEDCYFMLGDNRNNSRDSRFWINTFVTKDEILGKALFKYYPSIEWLGNR